MKNLITGLAIVGFLTGVIYLLGCVSLLVSNEVVLAALKNMGH